MKTIRQLFTLGLSLITIQMFAQLENSNLKCGVGLDEGGLIKERMLENRRLIPQTQIDAFISNRAIKYIPVKYTLVSNSATTGYVDIDNVLSMHCDLNNDYATQEIKFYLRDVTNSFRYSTNTNVYNNGASSTSQTWMRSNKVSNCVNIYLSASINNQVASYYTGFGDFIFVLNQMANGTSSTGSHEVGHFFSLPHTFYGWEGTTFTGGQAPTTVNGRPVERVARTTGANCTTAGDGFCDTQADYFSDRVPCPYSGSGTDPQGVQINPEESFIMSYYYDACVDSFSTQQKSAVAADIISRNWTGFAAPAITGTPSASTITATTPTPGTSIPLNGNITLTWAADPNATGYILWVERTLFGAPIETTLKTVVYGTNTYSLPSTLLSYPRQYNWKVRPFNQLNTCSVYSPSFGFTVTAPATAVDAEFKDLAELKILSNPVQSNTADLIITVPQTLSAQIQVYGMDGRQIISTATELSQGDNLQLLDLTHVSEGNYIVVVQTAEGSLQQKMTVIK